MKKRIARNAEKALAICFLTCCFLISAHAGQTTLTLKNGRATVKKHFQPRKQSDAHLYFLKLRRGQTVEIKVDSNEVYLSEENGCAMYFEMFDGKGKAVYIGEDPVGINSWEGEIKEAGNYKIKVAMSCIEAFSATAVRKKKPAFNYTLEVRLK
jgi:ribosomal protein L21E